MVRACSSPLGCSRALETDIVYGDCYTQQQIESSLDAWRYQHRLEDATRHSRNLARDCPVSLIAPPLASGRSFTGFSVRREVAQQGQVSRESYLHLLQQLDVEEYGEPLQKKQKKSDVTFEKENHALEIKRQNLDIARRLQKHWSGRRDRRVENAAGFGKMQKLSSVKDDERLQMHSETKEEEEFFFKPMSNGVSESNDVTITAKSRDEEIAELLLKLQNQHLSRTSEADRLFYDRLAERETNTLLEEALLEEVYELTAFVFEEEEEKLRSKELPPELLEIVEDALHEGPMEEVIIQKYNVDITRRHLQVLLPATWLNDEVINFYFQMMSDRDEALVSAGLLPKRSHFFNSFFYTKVSENGYNFINVRRWTRKIDLFAMDKIFMPVNVGNMHWCMAVIFMTEKRIQYYDSMHGSGAACLKVLLKYLHDESEHKKKQKFDAEGWELVTTTPDTPMQNNGSDCGVFSCIFADYVSQNRSLTFTQKDIPFHRHRMVLHVSRGYIPLEEEGL